MGGFTIVELLVVIVVIGILASISIVAYNGVQERARNAARVEEMQSWAKVFRLYKAEESRLPNVTSAWYCLGSGFPVGYGGVPRCRDYKVAGTGMNTDNISYPESENTALMAALKTVADVPKSDKKPVLSQHVGPYVDYNSTWGGNINQVFEGNECPEGTTTQWQPNTGVVICSIAIFD